MAGITQAIKTSTKTAGKTMVKTVSDAGSAIATSARRTSAKGKNAHSKTKEWDASQNPRAPKPDKPNTKDVDPAFQARVDHARTASKRLEDMKKNGEPNWGRLTEKHHGPKPDGMERPHGHHIVFKNGNGPRQRALLERSKEILERNGIDWLEGGENLIWAPNTSGQHTLTNVQRVLDMLEAADAKGPGAVADALRDAGRGIFSGKP
ncbi:MAG TPA: AHH domain-containing protein [Candidatus Agrococcus pullicola]|uniref:AHH domain-containing protein n=1 Tax=Candidatus Agrococcus pullicola TaxID=2838429 RepID=A0A9D2CAB0_9MICO|nr:AHH domain-containing protein [Candidatus Agrococcus pullicola]